jgi:glycosyltransferase involved in cell wall biosynthesis
LTLKSRLAITFVIPSFAGGGAERVMLQVAARLDRIRFQPTVIALDGSGPLRSELPEDVPILDLNTPQLRHAIRALRRAFSHSRPNVVFSTMGYLNMGIVIANIGLFSPRPRIVIREANIPMATLTALGSPISGKIAYRLLYRLADAIICNAEFVRDQLGAMGVPTELISVVHNPVDVDNLRRLAHENSSPDYGGFVTAGRLVHQKGYDRLLHWFAKCSKNSHLTIFGDGPQRAELTALIRSLGLAGRVELPGYCKQPWGTIARADAYLLPSRWEGMSNAALEALAVGTPVVACREAGGIKEIAATAGAVKVVDGGSAFVAAMRAIPPRIGEPALRPSLLPDKFALDTVVHLYEQILSGD